jgi:HK97 family phage major capsid protein
MFGFTAGPKLRDMKEQREFAIKKLEQMVQAAESAGRDLTKEEKLDYDSTMAGIRALNPKIKQIEDRNTLSSNLVAGRNPVGRGRMSSAAYVQDFLTMLRTRGATKGESLAEGLDEEGGYRLPTFEAALYESSNSAGGYGVSVPTDDVIVPLAPPETSVRDLSTVMATVAQSVLVNPLTTQEVRAARLLGANTLIEYGHSITFTGNQLSLPDAVRVSPQIKQELEVNGVKVVKEMS